MPRTRSGLKSGHDGHASAWEKSHAMTEVEQNPVTDLIRRAFCDRLGRTLDVGCGTGWPVTAGLAEPVSYVGTDPSTQMLDALVAKHSTLAGVHPMTWGDATRRRVLCATAYDTVLALGDRRRTSAPPSPRN
jgi:SAM-dependent methyltransferase